MIKVDQRLQLDLDQPKVQAHPRAGPGDGARIEAAVAAVNQPAAASLSWLQPHSQEHANTPELLASPGPAAGPGPCGPG